MRLTRKSDRSGMVWFTDHENNGIELEPCDMNSHHSRLAIHRLAEYEDTGLTPEEIGELKEKQNPKKATWKKGFFGGYACPVCGEIFTVKKSLYCPICGQAIDWKN